MSKTKATVCRLSGVDEAALEECLDLEPIINLFLRQYLAVRSIDDSYWYAVRDGEEVRSVVLVVPSRITVPFCQDPSHCALLGQHLRRTTPPTMMVGPRKMVDAIWHAWESPIPALRWFEQRLFECDSPSPHRLQSLRTAVLEDWQAIYDSSGAMELEELGRDPRTVDPAAHIATVKFRIRQNRTFISTEDGQLRFLIHYGLSLPEGCQLGGTYVPPSYRGQRIATCGVSETVRLLLKTHPLITLHVNEDNKAAISVYEACGFRPTVPYRLISL